MWTWTLNWGAVRDDLVVGSCPMTFADIDRIAGETGSTALLSLQHDECRRHFRIDYAAHLAHGWAADLVMVNAPMRDFDPPDQRRNLAADPAHAATVLDYAQKMLSWRMAHDDRTLANMCATADGLIEWRGPRG